jgi:hypothetical protein
LGKFGKRANALNSALSGGTEDSESLKLKMKREKFWSPASPDFVMGFFDKKYFSC